MSENLVEYLRLRQVPVTAVELAAEVLKLQNVPPATAAKLIASLLSGEEKVDRIGEESYLYRGVPERRLGDLGWLVCGALPERANHWSEWQAFVCIRCRAGETRLIGQAEAGDGTDWPLRLRELLSRIRDKEAGDTLVFSGFGNQISQFRRAESELLEDATSRPLLAMRQVAGALFPAQTIGGVEQLAVCCDLPSWVEADAGSMSRQLVNLWEHLLAALEERGIDSAGDLAEVLSAGEAELDLTPYAFDADLLRTLPHKPGVYLMCDREGKVIYVGKARNLAQRVKSYFLPVIEPDAKLVNLRRRLYTLEIRELGSELEALLLEQRLIRHYDPEINRQIHVLARSHRRRHRYPRILLLPASVPEWLHLFFLDPGKGLNHFWLDRAYDRAVAAPPCYHHWSDAAEGGTVSGHTLLKSEQELEEAVRGFFWRRDALHDLAAAEIAWSWLSEQEGLIHGIDIRQCTSAAEAVRLLEEYRLRLADWGEKVIFT
jgi:hypothetical protein